MSYIKKVAQRMAIATLKNAFDDYKLGKGNDYIQAKKWFKEKSQEPFGYFWCLEHGNINPNLVKKYLEEIDNKRNEINNNSNSDKLNEILTVNA